MGNESNPHPEYDHGSCFVSSRTSLKYLATVSEDLLLYDAPSGTNIKTRIRFINAITINHDVLDRGILKFLTFYFLRLHSLKSLQP